MATKAVFDCSTGKQTEIDVILPVLAAPPAPSGHDVTTAALLKKGILTQADLDAAAQATQAAQVQA